MINLSSKNTIQANGINIFNEINNLKDVFMIETFVLTLIIIVLSLLGLGVGYIFSRKPLKGSCGGLNVVMGEDCHICGKKDVEQCEETSL